MFRLLRLRPPHGWHAVVWELAIVTLGVLIALWAEQLIRSANDDRTGRATRQALEHEVEENLINVHLRGTAERCISRRLTELRAIVDSWGRTGTFETPSWVAQAPRLGVAVPRYEAALAAGHMALLPAEEQYQFGSMAEWFRGFQEMQDREADAWARLRLLQAGPETLSATDRTLIRAALQDAANAHYGSKLTIRQMLPEAEGYGFRPDMKRFEESARRIWRSGRYTPAICANIDSSPDEANRVTGQVVPLPF